MDGVREVDPVPQSFAEDEPFATVQDLVERLHETKGAHCTECTGKGG